MDAEIMSPAPEWQNADEDRVPVRIPRRRYQQIEQAVLDLYEKTDVRTIPFDVMPMASVLGIELVSYVSFAREAQQWARKASRDAFLMWHFDRPAIIFYNSKMPPCRLKFSLMHELAHACLLHRQQGELAEIAANAFAAAALCPLPLVEHYEITDAATLARVFGISGECAERRMWHYDKWKRLPISSRNVRFGMAVRTRFHLNVPYQPDLLALRETPARVCG